MCGVAGIFAFGNASLERAELRAMGEHMAMRGPDGSGEWFSADGSVGLAHRRLSIIDLSEQGAQPMCSPDGRFVISYNGEIYNYRELRRELQEKGRQFITESDTEVLLQLYAEKGEAMLAELRGMFAFALWDVERGRMLLARDGFGIKPLYYAGGGGLLRVASQVKALLKTAVDRSPSAAGRAGFFLWGSVPEPFTSYQAIRAVPAGHYIYVDAQGPAEPRAFCSISGILADASRSPAVGSRAEGLEAIAAAVHESVLAHQVSDVRIGVFLSAGIDSCLIASSAASQGAHSFTLTLGFREFAGTGDDEVPLAEEVARNLGSWHNTLVTGSEDFAAQRDHLLDSMDQPSIDGINTWFVARAAAHMDLKVALSGLGGDELFASYPSFSGVPSLVRFGRPLSAAPGLGKLLRKVGAPIISRLTSPKYAGLAEYSDSLASAYLLRRCLFAPWELPGLLGEDMARKGLEELQTIPRLEQSISGIESDRLAVSALEMQWYMRNQLLRDADWAGMSQSVEIRVPFLDVDLLRRAAPWFARYPDIRKREIAAVAAPGLPADVLSRPKTGFSVPVREWIRPPVERRQERGLRGWARFVYSRVGADAS